MAFGIYGVVERALVPFGLHHIWNVPFQMQIGEFTNAAGGYSTATSLATWRVTQPRANCPAASCSNVRSACCGHRLALGQAGNRAKVGIMDLRRVTSFLTGHRADRVLFMFVAPICT